MSRHGHDFLHGLMTRQIKVLDVKTVLQDEHQEVRRVSARIKYLEEAWGSKAVQYLQEVTGDIAGAASLRMAQPIGLIMLAVRECEELCDDIYENWVHDSQVVFGAQNTAPHCTSQIDDRLTDLDIGSEPA